MACPFCEPDLARVREREALVFALDDGYPVSPGHTLVIPRRHVADVFELREDERSAAMAMIGVVRERLAREHRPDGFNVGVNVGAAAGQTVAHAHVHVIPRFAGDVPDPRGGVRGVIPEKRRY